MLSVSLIFLSGCKKDEEPEVSSFVGEYVLTKATLTENLDIHVNELDDPMTLVAGFPITTMMQGALLGSIECEPLNSFIELREDFSVHLSCSTSSDDINAGTWEEQSETVLVLNLNSTAVPSAPSGVVLTVTDVSMVGKLLKGTTSIPISEAMLATIVEAMSGGQATLDTDATPDAVPIFFSIELEKQ